jgi:hypothetical protein
MPNDMDLEYLPAIPNHFRPIDWKPPNLDPINLDPLTPPSPGDMTIPNGPLARGRANGPNGGGETAPGGPVEYVLPEGGVYKAPPGTPSTWTRMEKMSFYNHMSITDALALVLEGAPPQAALLDEAGLEVCDQVEGDLFDKSGELEEAQELIEAAEAAYGEGDDPNFGDPDDFSPGDYSPEVIHDWMNRPEFGPPSDITTGNVIVATCRTI